MREWGSENGARALYWSAKRKWKLLVSLDALVVFCVAVDLS